MSCASSNKEMEISVPSENLPTPVPNNCVSFQSSQQAATHLRERYVRCIGFFGGVCDRLRPIKTSSALCWKKRNGQAACATAVIHGKISVFLLPPSIRVYHHWRRNRAGNEPFPKLLMFGSIWKSYSCPHCTVHVAHLGMGI